MKTSDKVIKYNKYRINDVRYTVYVQVSNKSNSKILGQTLNIKSQTCNQVLDQVTGKVWLQIRNQVKENVRFR